MRHLTLLLALALVACPTANDDDSASWDDDDVIDDDDSASQDDDDAADEGWDPADFDHVYEVGPGQDHAEPGDVPWETLEPSTLVRIHHRDQPYAAKWVIAVQATQDDPLVVLGVPSADGALPVITGDGATTRLELDYWNEIRSVIKVGGASVPASDRATWVWIEDLEIRSGHPAYGFTDDAGNAQSYDDNAASIHVEAADHLTIRGCVLHDSGNGLFVSGGSTDVAVLGSQLHGNGIVGSAYEHNSYTEALGMRFEGNRYGPLRAGADGNNLKDRSGGLVVRYNRIEGGNRQLDLVDAGTPAILDDPAYRSAFVYGNVLIEPDGAGNSQVVHYGGDSADLDRYRKGTLHFFHNTVVSTRAGNTTLLRLSSAEETADLRSNAVHATAGGARLAISNADGVIELRDNWLTEGWVDSHSGLTGTVSDLGNGVGDAPGFVDLDGQDFTPAAGSPLIDAAGALAAEAAGHPVEQQLADEGLEARPDDGAPDVGALEAAAR